eukprot:gene6524-8965_t
MSLFVTGEISLNITCSMISSCQDCISYQNTVGLDCSWCSATSKCLSSSSTNCSSGLMGTCQDSFFTIIFVVVLVGLCCLCTGTCYMRKYGHTNNRPYNRDRLNTLITPLIPSSAREFLFRNSLVHEGELEWMCIICGFDNKPRNLHCTLCGTEHKFTLDYKSKKIESIRHKIDEKKKKKEIVDITIPEEAQVNANMTTSFSFFSSSNRNTLTAEKKRDAINYRRLNQLSLRQKSARRRKMWQRVRDKETGLLTWARIPVNETIVGSAPFGYSPGHSFNEYLINDNRSANAIISSKQSTFVDDLLFAASAGPPSGNIQPFTPKGNSSIVNIDEETGYNTQMNRKENLVTSPRRSKFEDNAKRFQRGDSFGDSVIMSSSPGFTSVFDEDGKLRWEKVESGKPAHRTLNNGPSSAVVTNALLLEVLRNNNEGQMIEHNRSSDELIPENNDSLFDLEAIVAMTFKDKQLWFLSRMNELQRPWSEGHINLEIRRSHLLPDSFRAIMSLSPTDMHKWFRIIFHGEPGLDAGGLLREWFTLLIDAIFAPSAGLFTCSGGDSTSGSYHINPTSGSFNEFHLHYFKFVGRLFGKAIMEQQPLKASLSLPLRKQVISVPITFSDLEFVDDELYKNLVWLKSNENISDLMLDFTISYGMLGTSVTYDLKPGGSELLVTDENKEEYLQLRLRHRMLDSIKPQLENLLIGLYEVIPADLLSVFDYQELELLMCGIPDLDLDDWIRHTDYMGEYRKLGRNHPVIGWFWSAVASMTQEERIRLLQFTTGCSRLPAQGFKALQSNDGKYRKFNIQSVSKTESLYPRAHTCFNKIDLPLYDNQAELDVYMSVVINMEATGFTME